MWQVRREPRRCLRSSYREVDNGVVRHPSFRFSRVHVSALVGADAVERDRRRVGSNQDELAPSCVYHGGSVYVRESAKDWVGQVEGNDAVAIREDLCNRATGRAQCESATLRLRL